MGGQRRLGAHLAALAFEAVQQRGLLAAHIGAGAEPDFHVEGVARAHDVVAEIARFARFLDGDLQGLEGVGIFRAEIDIAVGGAHRDAGDGHALDEHEGIAFHDHAVGEGAAVAFVGVADDVFLLGRRLGHRAPLDAGGEAGAAAAAKAGGEHFLDDRLRPGRDGLLQAFIAAMGPVVLDGTGIDDAAAGEGEAGLVLEPGKLVHHADAFLVRLAFEHPGVDELADLGGLHRPVADTALRRLDLDQRLQPIHAARAGADDLDIETAALGFVAEFLRDGLGADAQRAGIAGDINAGHDCASLSSASSRSSSSAP